MNVLIVGDSPSRLNTTPEIAFVGARSYPTLMDWIERMGIERYELINSDTPVCMRTIKNWTGPIIALGKEAQGRLFRAGIKHIQLPHPSGLNRQTNDDEFITRQLGRAVAQLNKWSNGPYSPSKVEVKK